jgi:hypothetical protein
MPETAPPAGRRYATRAFGLEIDGGFEAPGLPPAIGPAVGAPVRMELAGADEIDGAWPRDGIRRVLAERFDGDPAEGPPTRTIDVHPEVGYRLYARGFGVARISADGARVDCAPPATMVDWSWQRFLVGRVLPWASVLRGYEAFHASAVVLDGRAVAFTGPTGWGKTSLALRLAATGAEFVSDDVLAVERTRDGPVVHPGANLAAVRPAERAAIPEMTWSRLGTVLGHSEKTYLTLPIIPGPIALGALCLLGSGDGPLVAPIPRPDPRALLASAFVLGIQSPARLLNQLDVCAQIANQVPVYRLRLAPGTDAGRLAEAVAAQLSAALA